MKKLRIYQKAHHVRSSRASLGWDRRRRNKNRLRHEDYTRRAKRFAASIAGMRLPDPVRGTWRLPNGALREGMKLIAPSDFRYEINPEEILEFIYALRREIFIRRPLGQVGVRKLPNFYISLDEINYIDLDGALILAAEFDRLRRWWGIKPKLDDENWKYHIRVLLREFGFYSVIEGTSKNLPSIRPLSDIVGEIDLAFVPFVCGDDADGKKAFELQEALIAAYPAASISRRDFYDGIVEAITNAVQHAYEDVGNGDGLPCVRRWWAGALVDRKTGSLNIAVYDQGASIPRTLPRQSYFQSLMALRKFETSDERVIAAALEYGRSRVEMNGRGNGLWLMCRILDDMEAADVRVTSGRGEVTYAKGDPLKLESLPMRFGGTMVRWRVKIPQEDGGHDHDSDS